MELEYGVRGRFSATHSQCHGYDWRHGHSYDVHVFATGDLDPETGTIRGTDTLDEALRAYLISLFHQDLDQVMPGVKTTPVGIAAHLMGVFVAKFQRVTEVVVVDRHTEETGRARRTPRVL